MKAATALHRAPRAGTRRPLAGQRRPERTQTRWRANPRDPPHPLAHRPRLTHQTSPTVSEERAAGAGTAPPRPRSPRGSGRRRRSARSRRRAWTCVFFRPGTYDDFVPLLVVDLLLARTRFERCSRRRAPARWSQDQQIENTGRVQPEPPLRTPNAGRAREPRGSRALPVGERSPTGSRGSRSPRAARPGRTGAEGAVDQSWSS